MYPADRISAVRRNFESRTMSKTEKPSAWPMDIYLLVNVHNSHNNPKIMKWNSHISIKNKEKKKKTNIKLKKDAEKLSANEINHINFRKISTNIQKKHCMRFHFRDRIVL